MGRAEPELPRAVSGALSPRMPTLLLLRHAKSSWKDDELDDFDRPLNSRGRRAAPAMGEVLLERGLVPGRVLCSPAERTRETWALVAEILGADVPASYPDPLYLAEAGDILDVVRREGGRAERLLVVGHNPGLQDLAVALAADGDDELRARMAGKFPTAALAILSVEGDWETVGEEPVRLVDFVRPKDLPDAAERRL